MEYAGRANTTPIRFCLDSSIKNLKRFEEAFQAFA